MKDLPRVDESFEEDALFCGFLDGKKKLQELGLVLFACVLLKGLPERKMLRLTLGREPMAVGRKKREGGVIACLVLGQMEADAANEVPRGAMMFKYDLGARRLLIISESALLERIPHPAPGLQHQHRTVHKHRRRIPPVAPRLGQIALHEPS